MVSLLPAWNVGNGLEVGSISWGRGLTEKKAMGSEADLLLQPRPKRREKGTPGKNWREQLQYLLTVTTDQYQSRSHKGAAAEGQGVHPPPRSTAPTSLVKFGLAVIAWQSRRGSCSDSLRQPNCSCRSSLRWAPAPRGSAGENSGQRAEATWRWPGWRVVMVRTHCSLVCDEAHYLVMMFQLPTTKVRFFFWFPPKSYYIDRTG
jgi:hypothetical protein